MIVKVIALLIGILIMGAGIYYLVTEKNDKEARKIYMITTIVGLAIIVVDLIQIML